MNSIFKKVYSGKVKRAISEGQLVPSETPDLYMKKSKTQEIEMSGFETIYPAKVFNVVTKGKTTEITTNTLSLQLTNVVVDGVPYFKQIDEIPTEALVGLDYVYLNNKYYLNTDLNYIQIGNTFYKFNKVLSLDYWDKSPNIKVRRLKDRFKITITNSAQVHAVLPLKSIFDPVIKNNWINLYDCFYIDSDNKPQLLATHSFELYDKTEIYTKDTIVTLKDIPVSEIKSEVLGDFLKVSYTSYRSNLYSNLELGKHLYFYLKTIDNQVNLYKSLKDYEGVSLFKISTLDTQVDTIEINPYLNQPYYGLKPESVYFVWDTDSKYAKANNVPLGCSRFKLDLNRATKLQVDSFEGYTQTNQKANALVTEQTEYQGDTDLDKLKTILETGVIV